MLTAPQSEGSVRTRMALIIALINCSGLSILSQYFTTGLKASLVVVARDELCSSCCSTGSGCLDA